MCTLNASGNGGFVYGFLTLPFWEPMGKLTFGAYLVHPMLLRIYYYSQIQLFHVTHVNQAVVFVAAATIGYVKPTVLLFRHAMLCFVFSGELQSTMMLCQ